MAMFYSSTTVQLNDTNTVHGHNTACSSQLIIPVIYSNILFHCIKCPSSWWIIRLDGLLQCFLLGITHHSLLHSVDVSYNLFRNGNQRGSERFPKRTYLCWLIAQIVSRQVAAWKGCYTLRAMLQKLVATIVGATKT